MDIPQSERPSSTSRQRREEFLIRLIAARGDRPDPLAPEVRFPLRETFAEVRSASKPEAPKMAAVCDISLRGVRLLCDTHLAPGESVQMRLLDSEGPIIACRVKWSYRESGEETWMVGAVFEGES